ncbi:MAG: prephenate dehydrogenase [Chitinophagaceae bacterium]
MVISVIGVGLIGGSLALSLREAGMATRIIGVDNNISNLEKALQLNLIDETATLEAAIAQSKLVIVAVPVDHIVELLPKILDLVTDQVVMDAGSTKELLLQVIAHHPNRKRFVATHPMAGTENSGPEAAISQLFRGKSTVLCDVENSDPEAVALIIKMYTALQMRVVYMDAAAHDLHAAYVSHISHITSFALALTVLEKEQEEEAIFELAGGGFESTVRLAKSSPDMWIPIFKQNRHNILDVLYEHIHQLKVIKQLLVDEDYENFYKLIQKSNNIRKILK